MTEIFKSILNADNAPIVICDLEHIIIYMNESAKKQYGNLCGSSLLDCHNDKSNQMIKKTVDWFRLSPDNNKIHTFYNQKQNKDVYMIALRNTDGNLIGYYEKHEFRTIDNSPFYDF